MRPEQVKLPPVDGLLMVLMKLRLDLHVEDLGYRFGISLRTVTRTVQRWIEVMFDRSDV